MKHSLSKIKKSPLTRLLFSEITIGLISNVSLLVLFIFLTRNVLKEETLLYDKAISNLVYSYRTPPITTVMRTITIITNLPAGIIVSLLVIFFLFKKHKKESLIFSLSLVIGCVINYLLKMYFKLPRPSISPLETLSDFTYPSGHAMNNLVLYGLLAFYTFHFTKNKLTSVIAGFMAVIWIGLIGLSRVYLGAHYPSDVLAGYLAGFWWLITVLLIDKTISFSQDPKKIL